MNKYFILLAIFCLILIAGIFYWNFFLPEESKPKVTGEVREITIVAAKNRWQFIPEVIEVNQGDKIILTLVNEDDYDHGFAIDVFGISQRMPANSTIKLEFTATKAGEFPFYCSVPCGEGMVDGQKRSHFDMIGKLYVRSLINQTK